MFVFEFETVDLRPDAVGTDPADRSPSRMHTSKEGGNGRPCGGSVGERPSPCPVRAQTWGSICSLIQMHSPSMHQARPSTASSLFDSYQVIDIAFAICEATQYLSELHVLGLVCFHITLSSFLIRPSLQQHLHTSGAHRCCPCLKPISNFHRCHVLA